MLKLNFQPPSAAFFREKYAASHGMQIYGKRRHCSLLLREETSDASTLGKGAPSLTEFLSRNECRDSRKSLLFLFFVKILLFENQILFCELARTVKHHLKRLWLVSIATIMRKTFKIPLLEYNSTQQTFWSTLGYHFPKRLTHEVFYPYQEIINRSQMLSKVKTASISTLEKQTVDSMTEKLKEKVRT